MPVRLTQWLSAIAIASIGALSIAGLSLPVLFVADLPDLNWRGCANAHARGAASAYSSMAKIDRDDQALPIARLDFDQAGPWLLTLTDMVTNRNVQTTDTASMKLLQTVQFECPGSDVATPHHSLSIFSNGKLVYTTGVFFENSSVAFQNSEFGYISPVEPKPASDFAKFMQMAFPGHTPIDYFSPKQP